MKIDTSSGDVLRRCGNAIGMDLSYFLGNGVWLLLRQVIAALFGFLMLVVFARYSTQEVLGQYQFILAVFGFIAALSLPGMTTAVFQSAANSYDGNYRHATRRAFYLSFLGVPLIILAASYFIVVKSDITLGVAMIFVSFSFPFYYALNLWNNYHQGRGAFLLSTRYFFWQSIVLNVPLAVLVFFYGDSLFLVAGAYFFLYGASNLFFHYRTLTVLRNHSENSGYVTYGMHLTRIGILGGIADVIDRISIGIFLGAPAIAGYTIASYVPVRLKDSLRSFNPLFLKKFSDEGAVFTKHIFYSRPFFLFSAVAMLVSVAYYFLIGRFIGVVFGPTYLMYADMSKWLTPLVFYAFFFPVITQYIMTRMNKRALLVTGPIQAVARIALNVGLTYSFGLAGAVIALVLSYTLLFLMYIYFICEDKDGRFEFIGSNI